MMLKFLTVAAVFASLAVSVPAFANELVVPVKIQVDTECLDNIENGCKLAPLPTFASVATIGQICLKNSLTGDQFCPTEINVPPTDEEELQQVFSELSELRKAALVDDYVANDKAKGQTFIVGTHIGRLAAEFNGRPTSPTLVLAVKDAQLRLGDVTRQIETTYAKLKSKDEVAANKLTN